MEPQAVDMVTCALCRRPIAGTPLREPATGGAVHPGCFAEQLPVDLVAVLLRTAALFAGPAVAVWAS